MGQSVHKTSTLLLISHFFPLFQHGSSPWLQSFRINLLQHCLSTNRSLLHCISSCCSVWPSTDHSVDICSDVVLSTGCRKIPAAQWSPPGAADLCSAHEAPLPALTVGLFLTLFYSLLSLPLLHSDFSFS